MGDTNTLDAFTSTVRDQRRQGYSVAEIALRNSVSEAEVEAAWREYVTSHTSMDIYERRVLHELRLENLLVRLNERIDKGLDTGKQDSIANMLKLLEQIEKLHALNTERQSETADMLRQISVEQGRVILTALYEMLRQMKEEISQAFESGRTIKAIRAEVSDVLDNRALPIAQRALEGAGQEQ